MGRLIMNDAKVQTRVGKSKTRLALRLKPYLLNHLKNAAVARNQTEQEFTESAFQAHPDLSRAAAVEAFLLDCYAKIVADKCKMDRNPGSQLRELIKFRGGKLAVVRLDEMIHMDGCSISDLVEQAMMRHPGIDASSALTLFLNDRYAATPNVPSE